MKIFRFMSVEEFRNFLNGKMIEGKFVKGKACFLEEKIPAREKEESVKELTDLTSLNFTSTDFEGQMKELSGLISPSFENGNFEGQLKDFEYLNLADFMRDVREGANAEVLVEFETTDEFEKQSEKVIMAYQKYLIQEIQSNGYSQETLNCVSYKIDLANRFKNGMGLDTIKENKFESVVKTLEELEKAEKEQSYLSTYETIKKVYTEINKNGINAYMIGGISSAIQAGIDLYRQNEDIDLMVSKEDLPQLVESLSKIGYNVEDKRGHLTENYIDEDGTFHQADHELNADINSQDMLGVGIFVFERKDGTVITNSYAYEENSKAVIGNQNIMPEELFDLMYSSEEIEYKGIPVKCQSKEFTYLSKSSGNREKDKLDAGVIEQYIGEDEQKKIDRIRKLQKRIVRYKNTYDKDGNIIRSEKMPGTEDKIANFIAGIAAKNGDLSNEELKEVIFNNETVKRFMEKDEDIRNIMNAIQSTSVEGDLIETSRCIAHSYIFDDIPSEEIKLFSEQEIGKATIDMPIKEKDETKMRVQREEQNLEKIQEVEE